MPFPTWCLKYDGCLDTGQEIGDVSCLHFIDFKPSNISHEPHLDTHSSRVTWKQPPSHWQPPPPWFRLTDHGQWYRRRCFSLSVLQRRRRPMGPAPLSPLSAWTQGPRTQPPRYNNLPQRPFHRPLFLHRDSSGLFPPPPNTPGKPFETLQVSFHTFTSFAPRRF